MPSTVAVSGCFQRDFYDIYLSQEKRQLQALMPGCFQLLSLWTLMSPARFVTECSHFHSMFIWFTLSNAISQYGKTWSLDCLSLDTEHLVGVQSLIPFLHPDQSSTSSQLLFFGRRLSLAPILAPAPQASNVALCTVF